LSWTLTNLGAQAVILESLTFDWPDNRPATKLNFVTFSNKIWSGNEDDAIAICSTCWNQGFPSDRMIATGATKNLSLGMSRSLYSGSYALTATFANLVTGGTCTVSTQVDYIAP
jgi:hypothetical protein